MNAEAVVASDIHRVSKTYWAGRVDAVHRHSEEHWLRLYAEELLALVPHGGTLLDVGCGSCQLTTYMAQAFERVVAFDFSDSMLEAGRERVAANGVSNVTVTNGDATRFPREAARADVILAHGVIQYFDDAALEKHLAECARVLAPGGVVCWGLVPNRRLRLMWYLRLLNGPRPTARELLRRGYHTWRRWRKARAAGDHLWDGIGNWFDAETLASRARAAGFDMTWRHSWFYEYRFHALLRREGE